MVTLIGIIQMRFFRRGLLGLFLTALTVGLLLAAVYVFQNAQNERDARNRPGQNRERTFTVNVLPIEIGTLSPELIAFGEVASGRTLELRTAASGALVELSPNFREGGSVTMGEVLFATDPASAQATLALAKTELREAELELSEATDALVLSNDELKASERQFALRIQAADRQKNLRKRGVGTEAAIETAELAASSAETATLGKRQSVANAKARINRSQTGLQRQEINVAEATRKLNDLTVRAGFDGALANVSGVLGGLTNANERLGELIDPNALEVAFRISSAQFANLASAEGGIRAAKVEVYFTGLAAPIPATVERSSAAVGEGLTGREVFARLTGEQVSAVRAGDFVTVKITEPAMQNVAKIPSGATTASGEVLVVGEDNRLTAATVKILRRQGDDLIVRARNIDGKRIVMQRAPQLGVGILIEPRGAEVKPVLEAPEDVDLTAEQQAAMAAFVKDGQMPDAVKQRMLKRIESGTVPKRMFDRINDSMGA
jgi:multidrug resistance efflux pump